MMIQAQTNDPLHTLIDDLREYISESQRPKTSDAGWVARAAHAGEAIYAALVRLKESLIAKQAAYATSVGTLVERLGAYTDGLKESLDADVLKARCNDLARSYEEFLLALRAARVERAEQLARSRQLKPTNYVRNLFHAAMGILAVSLYHFILTRAQALWILGAIFTFFGLLEVTRRFSVRWNDFLVDHVFGLISRPSERYRVNSSSLYVMALLIITAFFPKLAVEASILILGIGDPIASIFGRRFGRKKLFRDKSYAGSIAFLVAGFVVSFSLLFFSGVALGYALLSALVMSLAGAVTELLSSRIDDNFSIPLACATIGALLL
jgi:dolichol kinase